MDELKTLQKAVKKMLGLTDVKYAELLFNSDGDDPVLLDNALTLITDKNAEKIQTIKDDHSEELKGAKTESNNEGYKRAQKEIMPKVEREFKEQTGFESELKGTELFVAGVEAVKKASPDGPTIDQVKAHPTFLDMEKNLKADGEEKVQILQGEFDTFKNGVSKQSMYSTVKTKAWDYVLAKKPNIEEGKIGENRKTAFLRQLEIYDFKSENGTEVILKDEKRVEDNQGNALTFEQLIENISNEHFTYIVQDPKGGAGNGEGGGGGGAAIILVDEADFNRRVALATTMEEKNKLLVAYKVLKGTKEKV